MPWAIFLLYYKQQSTNYNSLTYKHVVGDMHMHFEMSMPIFSRNSLSLWQILVDCPHYLLGKGGRKRKGRKDHDSM